MGIYYKTIENFFNNFPEVNNNLQTYDNYTYHIQLYVVPVAAYRKFTEIKASGNSYEEQYTAIRNLLKNNKIVIAESGVTPNYDIKSLKMVMNPPVSSENRDMIVTNAEMTITEVDGASFMNKFATVTMAAGYESFALCPVFLEIWFSGYDQPKGKVVSRIPFAWGDKESDTDTYIISCMMSGTSTIQEADKTTYRLKLYPYFYTSINKDLQIINNLGPVSIDNMGLSLPYVLSELETKINEKLLELYGDTLYHGVYGNEKPVKIVFLNQDILTKMLTMRSRETDALMNGRYEEALMLNNQKTAKQLSADVTSDYDDYANEMEQNQIDQKKRWKEANGFWESAGAVLQGVGEDFWTALKGAANLTASTAKNLGTGAGNAFKIKWAETKAAWHYFMGKEYDVDDCKDLSDLVKKVLLDFCLEEYGFNKGEIISVDYKPIFVKEYLGKKYYRHIITISIKQVPGLYDMANYNKSKLDGMNTEVPEYTEDPVSRQLRYLIELGNGKLLAKKYRWKYSGTETCLLNLNYSDNNLWYMNIGISNLNMIDSTTVKPKPKTVEPNPEALQTMDLSEFTNAQYGTGYITFKNGNLYMDDIYDGIVDKFLKDGKKKNLTFFNIVEANDPTTEIKPIAGSKIDKDGKKQDQEELSDLDKLLKKGEVAFLIGMTNIFQYGGQRLKMNADIIGDPFWLLPSTEVTPSFQADTVVYMPHVIISSKVNRSKTGMDEYRTDPLMELNVPYIITKVTSTFEGGKFLQNLEGFVPTPFIQSSNDEESARHYEHPETVQNDRKKAETTDAVPPEGN